MRVDRSKVMDLINTYCAGNYSRFGRELGVDTSHIHRFVNTGVGGGKKIVGALLRFCKEKGINFEEFVEL
ncbi:MAG: hypothetical protein N3B21_15535 [Clostridia bacterium]|nr:hypothetical protein [Clostridia bacterium]